MIESALERRQVSLQMKLTVKALISIGVLVLAVVLPQLAHLAVGEQAGKMLLPMYLPVLLGGCLLGWKWGLGVGVLSPVVSFLLTSAAGQPMPVAGRLPFMMAELAVFAVISGLFSKRIVEKAWLAFPAVVLAELVGRAFFLLIAAVFQPRSSLSAVTVWAQIQTGFIGLALQAVVTPLMVMGLAALLKKENGND